MSNIVEDIALVVSKIDGDFTFLFGDNFEANKKFFIKNKTEAPFVVLNQEVPSDHVITQANVIKSNIAIELLFLQFDSTDSDPEDSIVVISDMRNAAYQFMLAVETAPFVDPNINIDTFTVVPHYHRFDADLSGVLLTFTAPKSEIDISFCP